VNTTATPGKQSHDTIAATIELLAETYPRCFFIFEQRRRPLKVGIHHDILAALDGAITPRELGIALRFYTGKALGESASTASRPAPSPRAKSNTPENGWQHGRRNTSLAPRSWWARAPSTCPSRSHRNPSACRWPT
jgi:ProQ/FINO family